MEEAVAVVEAALRPTLRRGREQTVAETAHSRTRRLEAELRTLVEAVAVRTVVVGRQVLGVLA